MADAARLRLVEPAPPVGVPLKEEDGIVRVVANNPGPMTYHGTNTWLVEHGDRGAIAVIDPGPNDPSHVEAILRAAATFAGGGIDRILVSHAHADHAGAAPALAAALDLPIDGHAALFAAVTVSARHRVLADGDTLDGLAVLHTPGHAAEHLCFARLRDGVLFTADHVMGWSTSVVPPPPFGDAADYLRSLRRLQDRTDRLFLPGHGPAITRPRDTIAALLTQRRRREREVATLLGRLGPVTVDALVPRLYPRLKPGLDRAARANVLGLLHKLLADGGATRDDETWSPAGTVVHPPEPPGAVEKGAP